MRKIIYYIFGIIFCFNFLCFTQDKVRMYVFYTPSHEKMFYEYFLPSIQDDFDLVVERHQQTCLTARFMQKGWFETMLMKVNIIIRGIQENWGKIFIHSDTDVQFFAPIKEKIFSLMGNNDVLFQLLDYRGYVCPGFLVCRGNKKTLKLWNEVKKRMLLDSSKNDQDHLNDIVMGENYCGVTWDYLPVEFFSAGLITAQQWFPGRDLKFPKNIVLHHATYAAGTRHKIKQFIYLRKLINNTVKKKDK